MIGSVLNGLFGRQYTIGDLMNIDAGRQQKASGCSVTLDKTFHILKQENLLGKLTSLLTGKSNIKVYYVVFKFSVMSDTGHAHTVFIQTDPDFSLKNWTGNKVKVYCDCQDFKYRSAYLLNQRNSLFSNNKIKIALGQAITDAPKGKRGTTLLCKHAFAALSWLMKNYSVVMKTI